MIGLAEALGMGKALVEALHAHTAAVMQHTEAVRRNTEAADELRRELARARKLETTPAS